MGQMAEVDRIRRNDALSYYGKLIQVMGVLTGRPAKELAKMDKKSFFDLRDQWDWFFTDKSLEAIEPKGQFIHRGRLYEVTQSIGEASMGEYADMETQVNIRHEDPWEATAAVIAIYCREPGEMPLDSEEVLNQRITLFKQLPLPDAVGLRAFFLSSEIASDQVSRFSMIQRAEVPVTIATWLVGKNSSGGLRSFTAWPKRMLGNWITYWLRNACKC